MDWFRRLPFLAVLVFGIGVGLGVAWKTGWIPVELGEAKKGSLSTDTESVESDVESPVLVPVTEPSESTRNRTTNTPIFAPPTKPALLEPTPDPRESFANTNHRPVPNPVLSGSRPVDEPEWARPPASPAPVRTPSLRPTLESTAGHSRPASNIQQVSHQEPSNDETPIRDVPADEPSIAEDLKTIDEQIANQEILAAHRSLSKLYWNHKQARPQLMPRLDQTAKSIFFEPRPHLVEPYIVQPNDQLRVIASKYQLSWEYLAKLNRTEPRRIQLNQKLKVLKGPFAAVVDLNDYALTVHLQGYYVKRYLVGIGKDGASPIGKFTVRNKIENPQYTGPDGRVISGDDPSNPLGERWIDLGDSYGIHGTIEPDSIGKAASRGCIRMRENDVIEVYNFLVNGSEVVIRK